MKVLKTAFLITVLALALTSTISASTLANGSIAFGSGVVSYVGASLSVATSITVVANGGVQGGTGLPFGCPQPNCSPGFGDIGGPSGTVTFPTTFTVPLSVYVDFITWGDGTGGANNTRYSFSSLASTKASVDVNTLTVFATGTFTDALGVYTTNTASLILNLTQTGGRPNQVSLAGTINTPAAFSLVPEPGTLVLFGGALVGLGLIRRRKTA